jgi:hypothetical protein
MRTEMLIAGRELGYLKRFQNCEAVNSRAFTNESKETCARAYGMPGALRAGFEYYRAFPNDVKANQEFAKRKLTTPVLGIGGSGSFRPIICSMWPTMFRPSTSKAPATGWPRNNQPPSPRL